MNLIDKIKLIIIGREGYLKLVKKRHNDEILAFERMLDKLYNEGNIEEYFDFIKKTCLNENITNAEEERIEKGLNELKKYSNKIKEFNDFIKYLAVFSKIKYEEKNKEDDEDYENNGNDENNKAMICLFEKFYKLFKKKEINLDLNDNINLYEAIKINDIGKIYERQYEFSNEIPNDFYDNEEIEHIVYKFLTENNYKDKLISILIKHYSNPAIFFNEDFVKTAVLFNYYYLVYKVLNNKIYKINENKENEDNEEEENEEEEKEEKPKRIYHIRKTILIIIFLLILLMSGTIAQHIAILIGIYYAIKGMLK